ncbi:MAG: 30S ribosomal protein S13 [Bdellovibrionales bacterium RIFOXYA1_FULL_36_14]|nr:MAG: 30S ribosomal protein S13 [Bdellovibrionales bacterium RIFOXYA1_FULL_36_14]OFZ27063.1 MAG: 30S ribosomal protein S13 [Bdellovibrionales bacterium RIFOXYA1_FULL_38_20]OFZ47224.1 MAG: 30S ribosomal protein S13 [Bdellovibrionales bacterium RIFOXYC1_FULL_37_79]OFZ62495.1 MAG: 30S ribosomal protein S13 [Bdellovibrionales bacterium RIFOXYD1_FULL_36_51]OFZ65989.1 MAG: 30S ribosomal protein S13 [Bdellovibrionales bacterium RIFOXYB2_FULL_36_6]
MARILGVDIPRNKAMRVALTYIYGIGNQLSKDVLTKANIPLEKNSNDLTEEEAKNIRLVIEDGYVVEGDLRRELGLNIKRLKDMSCYRGARHRKSLPCRGQRTHTNARTRKGKAVAIAGKKSIKAMKG